MDEKLLQELSEMIRNLTETIKVKGERLITALEAHAEAMNKMTHAGSQENQIPVIPEEIATANSQREPFDG